MMDLTLVKEGFDKQHINKTMEHYDEIIDSILKSNEILGLGNSGIYTMETVKHLFSDCPEETIIGCIRDNTDELLNNGMEIITGKELKEKLVKGKIPFTNLRGSFECEGQKFANRSNRIFSKRSILLISMKLTKSKIAERVRSDILDLIFVSDKNGTTQEKINDNYTIVECLQHRLECEENGDMEGAYYWSGMENLIRMKYTSEIPNSRQKEYEREIKLRCDEVYGSLNRENKEQYWKLYHLIQDKVFDYFEIKQCKDFKSEQIVRKVIPYIREIDISQLMTMNNCQKYAVGKWNEIKNKYKK